MRARAHLLILLVLTLIAGLWPVWLWGWWIEDSAISFSFARNLAQGHGLVAFPGGERVEGFSNPLWVAGLALFELVGVEGFQSSRWVSVPLAAGCIPLVYQVGRRLRPDRVGIGLIAAVILASDCIFGIWTGSGLENPLFCFLLALAMWRTLVEGEEGGFPWAAVAFLGLALTRPEGIVYAAFGGFWGLVIDRAEGRSYRRTLAWFAVFWIPFGAYFAARYAYFAYPYPATYYAKMGGMEFQPYHWNARAWMYLRNYCADLQIGWLIPLFFVGVTGMRGARLGLAAAAISATGLVLLVPASFVDDELFRTARFWMLSASVVSVTLALWGRPAWRVVGLAWGLLLVGVWFSIRSSGDWMLGFRFMSLIAVPQAVLLAAGIVSVGDGARELRGRHSWGWPAKVLVLTLLACWVVPHVSYFSTYRPPVTPFGVKKRLDHYRKAKVRLQMIEPAVILDHDLGGMMWFGTDFGKIIDARGLVDVPFAMHQKRPAFTREYLLEQNPFDFCHAHASTGAVTKTLPGFRQNYIEFPGFRSGKGLHIGNYLRKDLLVSRDWPGPDHRVEFERDIVLEGYRIVSPEVGPDSGLYLEIGLSAPRAATGFRMFAFIAGPAGVLEVWDVPPGYDDWYPTRDWKNGEIFHGKFSFTLRGDLPIGEYDLGFAAIDRDGKPVELVRIAPGSEVHDPLAFMDNEVRFPGAVDIVPREEMFRLADEDIAAAVAAAEADRCQEAEEHWVRGVRHRTRNGPWRHQEHTRIANDMASCWARTAMDLLTPREQAEQIRRARLWDRDSAAVQASGAALADSLWPAAMAARDAGDHDTAFELFDCAVMADPTRSWARRYAEEARGLRFGWVAGSRERILQDELDDDEVEE
mgnify:CR=1 FL=1